MVPNAFGDFDDEMARTRKVLAAIPREHMDWQLNPKLRSIGWNANHIADTVSWTKLILEQDEFDIAPTDGPKPETPTLDDPSEILDSFDNAVEVAHRALSEVSDETLAKNWEHKLGGQTIDAMSKQTCIRRWVLNHTIHHRGILSVYLRMCGVELTPVYEE